MTDSGGLRAAITTTVSHLVNGEYELLERLTRGKEMSAEQLRHAITVYGRTLIMPPDDALPEPTLYDRSTDTSRIYYAEIPLWTLEEGYSDLTLEARFIELTPGSELWLTELVNLHVM